jgi:hypothetical protein
MDKGRRSITQGLQPTVSRQLSPAEQAFKETGSIPENLDVLTTRQHESTTTRQHENMVGPSQEPVSSLNAPESSSAPVPEATKQITVRIPVSMWSALIQRVTENKAQGSPLSSQQDLIQHLIQQWLNQQEKERFS